MTKNELKQTQEMLETMLEKLHRTKIAEWEATRETISSKHMLALDKKVDDALVKMEDKIATAFRENKELAYLREIGNFWSVSGFLMKAVIGLAAFFAAIPHVSNFINKVLHYTNK